MPSVTIVWDPPLQTGGNQDAILNYKVKIPELIYEKKSTRNSHTITANGTHIMFNMAYLVQVIAINTCEDVSDPANATIIVEASGKYMHTAMHKFVFTASYSIRTLSLGVW